jgi:hypothetical protein
MEFWRYRNLTSITMLNFKLIYLIYEDCQTKGVKRIMKSYVDE